MTLLLGIALLASLSAANDEIPLEKRLPLLATPQPRRVNPGDIGLPLGTVLDPSCKDYASNLEKAVSRAVDFNNECASRLPYTSFTASVGSILPQAVIICADWSADFMFLRNPNSAAYSPSFSMNAAPQKRVRDAAGDAGTLTGRLAEDADVANTSGYAHLYFIVINKSVASGDVGRLAGFLWHETMHHTGWNSRNDHTRIEGIAPDPERLCDENALDDRIIFLQTACRVSTEKELSGDLLQRIEQCGIDRACMQPLTDVRRPDASLLSPTIAQRAFSTYYGDHPAEAAHLCKNIRASLDQQVKDREIPDPHRFDRYKKVFQYVLDHGGGLARGVPAYYYAPMTMDQRRALSQVSNLDAAITGGCGALDYEYVGRGSKGRMLLSTDPKYFTAGCPFAPGNPLHDQTVVLSAMHDLESDLQHRTVSIMDDLAEYILIAKHTPEAMTKELNRLYDADCGDRSGFQPELCQVGRQAVQAAIDEARQRFEPSAAR
jgi:hypothetical protein